MCGIAGYIGTRQIAEDALQSCLKLMHRRGPDSAAYFHHRTGSARNIYLLHARLNIVDFDARSNQPFHAGSKVIAFNGELYNYIELKKQLMDKGCTFKTESDTEVLVEMINQYGIDSLDQCEGMWAFAVLDKHDGSLMLSRDRFGEKPLFIYSDESGLYFGSETKFIVALSGAKLKINYHQLYRLMIHGYRALYKDRQTFFHDLGTLPSGTNLHVSSEGKVEERRYWQPHYQPDDNMTYGQAVEKVKTALIRAVDIRLRADVPLAFCLSGGIDSNAVASIAKKVLGYEVHGFTIISDDPRFDEREMVERSVADIGVKYTPVHLSTDGFLPNLRTMIRQHDAPVYFVAYYPHWLLMKGVADAGYRIVVSGTAADELFCGYYDHHLGYLREVKDDPVAHAEALKNWSEHVLPIIRNPYWRDSDLYINNPNFRSHLFIDGDDFSDFLCHGWSESFIEEHYTDNFLRNRTMNEIFHETTPGILHSDDLNAMYFSLENRSPFLDRQLFDVCYSIPTRHLIRGGYSKAILRDAVRGIAPDIVLANYQKTGFNAPIYELLNVHDPEVRAYLLDDSPIFDHIRREKIEELISMPHLPTSKSKFLHAFVNAKIFIEEFG